jgi:sulfotransferase
MNKKYHFLSGLPRAGNTLLGSILNQNKNISVTANSSVSEMMYRIETVQYQVPGVHNFPDIKSLENVNKNILINYYSDWKSKFIIDRSCWGTPDNLEMLKKYCPNEIKIIVPLREITEVLASFIKWAQENPNNFLDHFETVEEKCDFLMNPQGQIIKQLYSIHNLMRDENKKYTLFLHYNDLINDPQKSIEKVYEFLKIRKYNHHYENLSQLRLNGIEYCDDIYGKNLHNVKSTKVEKTNYKPVDYLPQSIIDKYSCYNPNGLDLNL